MEDVIVEPDPGGKNNDNLVCKEKLLINSSYRLCCFGILIFFFVFFCLDLDPLESAILETSWSGLE